MINHVFDPITRFEKIKTLAEKSEPKWSEETKRFEFWAISGSHAYSNMWYWLLRWLFELSQGTSRTSFGGLVQISDLECSELHFSNIQFNHYHAKYGLTKPPVDGYWPREINCRIFQSINLVDWSWLVNVWSMYNSFSSSVRRVVVRRSLLPNYHHVTW